MNQPDELLTLPTAFLVAGAGGAIATLWPVPDLSTALLMDRLYALMADGTAPVRALQQAQADLAAMTSGEVLRFRQLNGLRPQAQAERTAPVAPRTQVPAETAVGSAASPTAGVGQPPRGPFAHPFYWAGFVYIGA